MRDDPLTMYGLIFQAAGGDLDGLSPKEWAYAAKDPALYALDAVTRLSQDYDEALSELTGTQRAWPSRETE